MYHHLTRTGVLAMLNLSMDVTCREQHYRNREGVPAKPGVPARRGFRLVGLKPGFGLVGWERHLIFGI